MTGFEDFFSRVVESFLPMDLMGANFFSAFANLCLIGAYTGSNLSPEK